MSWHKYIVILLLFLASFSSAMAQNVLQKKELVATAQSQEIDTLSIIPNSVAVYIGSQFLKSEQYQIDFFNASISFVDSLLFGKTVTIQYRLFSLYLNKPIFKRSRLLIEKQQITSINDFRSAPNSITNPWLDKSSDLSKSGSITRGISIGNRQDVVVNSDLNLQLDGAIFDDFNIKAVISDKNIPLQPEGNTQQLQEFDKVFIQIYNPFTKITAGDFDIITPQSQFMKANKKVLGGQVVYQTHLPDSSKFSTSASFAMAKGKFTRVSIIPIEGNQGPYRLTNENGDANIIVIGGSERVFIDGIQLSRGQSNDYTVDYNMGEIVFTPKIILSKESKITVEFEYTDRHYSRSLMTNFNQWQGEKISAGFHIYSEQDMKNQSIQPELSSEQKIILRNAGYQTDLMIAPAFDSTSFNTNQIRYKLKDTLVNSTHYDSVFVYSTNPDSAFYALSFTYVGANNGNYVLLNNTINGRVFAWIAPENGISKGAYNPIYILIPPQKKQMVVGKIEYQISKKSSLNAEVAFSNFDKNTFATIPKSENYGGAISLIYINKQKIKLKDSLKLATFTSRISHQFISKNFNEIEPNKNSEFFRRFNIQPSQTSAANLNLLTASFLFENPLLGSANYTFNYLDYYLQFKGIQHQIVTNLSKKYIDFVTDANLTKGDGFGFQTDFIKQSTMTKLKTKIFSVGGKIDNEYALSTQTITDSLLSTSVNVYKYELFIQNHDSATLKYRLWHNYKTMNVPFQNKLSYFSNTSEDGMLLNIKSKTHSLDFSSTYREVRYASRVADKNDFALIASVTHQSDFFKGAIVINTYYQTSTGREQKREYQYLKVAKGQGQYIWTDFNNDNIEDLDEFPTSPFPDQAEYIRIWLLTNDYVKTIVNEYNQTLLINPASIIKKKSLFFRTLSLLKNQTSIFTNNKTMAGPEIGANPFVGSDEQNITSNKSIRNNFYINQSNPRWNVEYIVNRQYNKMLLAGGFENRNVFSNNFVIRSSPFKKISTKIDFGLTDKSSHSEILANRNYSIFVQQIETTISYLRTTNFRSTLSYKYLDKKATNNIGTSPIFFNQFNFEVQVNIPKKGVVASKISAINVKSQLLNSSPMTIELLEGLTDGLNIIYNLNFQTLISKNIQLNATYEMRLSSEKNIVHVGNISVRAFF